MTRSSDPAQPVARDDKHEEPLLGEGEDRPLGGEAGATPDSLAQHTPERLKQVETDAEPLLGE